MNYIELNIKTHPEFQDIIVTTLCLYNFESFQEVDGVLKAYIPENLFSREQTQQIIDRYPEHIEEVSFERIESKNWNEEWENNFHPIIVNEECIVRADFHKVDGSYPFDIIINPKMSFGTGHHETTFLMLQEQLKINMKDCNVLDVGCGTGILSILCSKKGAKSIDAIDIDEWAANNSQENIVLNQCDNIHIWQGEISLIKKNDFYDIILANINRNVLLSDTKCYASLLKKGGLLMLSGFYTQDASAIVNNAQKYNLWPIGQVEKNNWMAITFKKNETDN